MICPTGKIAYTNPTLAYRAARRMKRKQRAYRCEHCHSWHLTSHL